MQEGNTPSERAAFCNNPREGAKYPVLVGLILPTCPWTAEPVRACGR